ncbi:MAG: IS1595 family transposase [Alphaproteobacteria bacterium]|nr:IS1595 family transposase [Alphaproteobacteria bacterium]
MAQHFLLSRKAKTLSLAQVFRMSDAEAETAFAKLRWADTNGEPVCPTCGGLDAYDCRRANGAPRYRCRACRKDFSITSGTLFASHKLPLRAYLAAIAIFCNEVKGKSMLAMSRDLGLSYKAAFVLCHKMREAMAEEMKGRTVEAPVAEVDGAYFGGYVRQENRKEDRKDRRLKENKSTKRQVVVVVRERGGETLPGVFKSEAAALSWIRAKVARETVLHADESPAWNALHSRFEMRRVNHEVAFKMDDACTNQAESYFSRLRRAEIGHHHKIAGVYLIRYAQEMAWREDNRRMSNGDQVNRVGMLALNRKPSVDFCGYWQRAKAA